MSNIYIQEPSTNGKVIIKTTLGDIDVELWPREAPKACRNFVQLCMEGYYNGTIFHRVIKGFIAQGGDPTGTGFGGDSIYGEPFKDEFHSRLRFVRRGLLAMANAEKDSNGSQFFFTLGACPELQDKHTIFGKVAGNTLYNMIKFDDLQVDQNERPLYPPKIISTEVVFNPFDDIVPRKIETKKSTKKEERPKVKGTKDFKLLSFGDEAEEEEEEISAVMKEFKGKSKSSHDLLNDPKLSSVPAVEPSIAAINSRRLKGDADDKMEDDSDSEDELKNKKKRDKLRKIKDKFNSSLGEGTSKNKQDTEEGALKDCPSLDEKMDEGRDNLSKLEELKKEYKLLKKSMMKKLLKDEKREPLSSLFGDEPDSILEYRQEIEKYKKLSNVKKKDRANDVLSALEKFQMKLEKSEKEKSVSNTESPSDDLFTHKLVSEEEKPVLAKDANIKKDADWFDIYDPRNPVNKRRREAGGDGESKNSKSKKHHRDK